MVVKSFLFAMTSPTRLAPLGQMKIFCFRYYETEHVQMLSAAVQKASEMARHEGLPRIYIAANSGARIGLANEVKNLFKIAWIDPTTPDKVY